MLRLIGILITFAFLMPAGMQAADNRGAEVIVIFNSSMPESKAVAEHYAAKRQVPTGNLLGLKLPKDEVMSRADFDKQLQGPLIEALVKKGFWKYSRSSDLPSEATIRYAALCYGVPLKIAPVARLKEKETEKAAKEFQRNEAAVDSELALLPFKKGKRTLGGPLRNPAYGHTNMAVLHPTNGVFLVTRLDGPTPEIAKGLVDKALIAEAEGLWGRAYFDTRGLKEGDLLLGDDTITRAARAAGFYGMDVLVDTAPATFSASFPLSHVAIYAGWYDPHVSGPFSTPTVDFMPGAIAYHLHSFSAATVRVPWENWVAPLLARGATVSFGTVYEPYLAMTPNVGFFFAQLLLSGYTFGEAAISAQEWLSWQTTLVGDPLYRPSNKGFREQFEQMKAANSKYMDWAHVKILNGGTTNAQQVAAYLADDPSMKTNAILQEKLGDAYLSEANLQGAIEPYETALKHATNQQQRVRLRLHLGRLSGMYGRSPQAYEAYDGLLKEYPNYPDRASIYQKLVDLANSLGLPAEAAAHKAKIAELKKEAKPD